MTSNRLAPLLLAVAGAAAGCGDSTSAGDDDDDVVADAQSDRTLRFELTNVPPLGDGFVYEGWAVIAGEAVSTGRFTIDASGVTTPASFTLASAQIDTFVLSIEPEPEYDPGASATHILAGDLDGLTAELRTDHAAALGSDFATAAGGFVLATPTTAATTADNDQGIWWVVPGDPPVASLTLPVLPEGWMYEGWVAGADGPVSTGRFTAVDAADGDGAGPTAGPDGGPPFPGQDFISPAMDLNGGDLVAVITVEPQPDDTVLPFGLKPLVTSPIGAATAPAAQPMENAAAASLPSGQAILE